MGVEEQATRPVNPEIPLAPGTGETVRVRGCRRLTHLGNLCELPGPASATTGGVHSAIYAALDCDPLTLTLSPLREARGKIARRGEQAGG
jgi:hypothetical protein